MGSSLVRETSGDQARRSGRSCAAKPASRQTDRQAGRQGDRQTGRQTDKHEGREVVACLRETT